MLREKEGKVVVYLKTGDTEELVEETDIATEFLTETDRIELQNGIEANGRVELNQLIEDYDKSKPSPKGYLGRKEKMGKKEFVILIIWGIQLICGPLGGFIIVLMIYKKIGIVLGLIILTIIFRIIIGGTIITYMLMKKKTDTSP